MKKDRKQNLKENHNNIGTRNSSKHKISLNEGKKKKKHQTRRNLTFKT
jgi:hypothetical protein